MLEKELWRVSWEEIGALMGFSGVFFWAVFPHHDDAIPSGSSVSVIIRCRSVYIIIIIISSSWREGHTNSGYIFQYASILRSSTKRDSGRLEMETDRSWNSSNLGVKFNVKDWSIHSIFLFPSTNIDASSDCWTVVKSRKKAATRLSTKMDSSSDMRWRAAKSREQAATRLNARINSSWTAVKSCENEAPRLYARIESSWTAVKPCDKSEAHRLCALQYST
eukprot:scaffold2142_cov165-Amphora_coffeaeformis.AAC.5